MNYHRIHGLSFVILIVCLWAGAAEVMAQAKGLVIYADTPNFVEHCEYNTLVAGPAYTTVGRKGGGTLRIKSSSIRAVVEYPSIHPAENTPEVAEFQLAAIGDLMGEYPKLRPVLSAAETKWRTAMAPRPTSPVASVTPMPANAEVVTTPRTSPVPVPTKAGTSEDPFKNFGGTSLDQRKGSIVSQSRLTNQTQANTTRSRPGLSLFPTSVPKTGKKNEAAKEAPPFPFPPAADPADAAACIRELAAYASMQFAYRQTKDGKQVGPEGTAPVEFSERKTKPDPHWEMKQWAALERLVGAEDASIREAALAVQPLLLAAYRLHCAQAEFGYKGQIQAANQLMTGLLYRAAGDLRDAAEAAPRPIYDGLGRQVGEVRPGTAQGQLSREAEQSMWEAISAMRANDPEGRFFTNLTRMSMASRQEELMKVWERHLFPKLEALAGPVSESPLVECGPLTDYQWVGYGTLWFGNPKTTLNNLAVRIAMKDPRGYEAQCYGFIAKLAPGQAVRMEMPLRFRDAAATSPGLDVKLTVLCDEGQMRDVAVDMSEKPPASPKTMEELAAFWEPYRDKLQPMEEMLPRIYPVCLEPRALREKLLARLAGADALAGVMDGGTVLLTSKIGKGDNPAIEMQMVSSNESLRRVATFTGRLMPEIERGTVVGFETVSIVDTPLPPPGKVSSQKRSAGATEAGARLLTSPSEIADFNTYRRKKALHLARQKMGGLGSVAAGMLMGEGAVDMFEFEAHSDEETRAALAVLSLDTEGRPWFQGEPGVNDEVRFVPLEDFPLQGMPIE